MTQTPANLWILFLIFSLTALLFLIYSVVNRDTLDITLRHPRIVVEFTLFVIFALLSVLFYLD